MQNEKHAFCMVPAMTGTCNLLGMINIGWNPNKKKIQLHMSHTANRMRLNKFQLHMGHNRPTRSANWGSDNLYYQSKTNLQLGEQMG